MPTCLGLSLPSRDHATWSGTTGYHGYLDLADCPCVRVAIIFLVATLLTALSGCTVSNGPDGQAGSSEGALAYNGASEGSHSSQPFDCDGTGKVSLTYNLGSGSIDVTVTDGAGTTVWSKTFSNTGQGGDSESITGTEGAWVVKVTRSSGTFGGFSGQYAVNVDC